MNTPAAAIKVANSRFFIDNTIESAPKGLMFRELLRNAFEASLDTLPPHYEHQRRIRFFADSAGKLSLINSGVGMTANELLNATDLASSGANKIQGLDGRNNRGEGAKISALRWNGLGMRYRSRKDGVISEVVLFNDDGENGVGWAREQVEIDDNYFEVWEVDPIDLDAEEIARYADYREDFTEVTLFGNELGQQTAFNPYGDATDKTVKLTIAHELFGRFYRFPDVGIPVRVQFNEEFRAGASFREFMPIGEIAKRYSSSFENYDQRMVNLSDGVQIEYLMFKSDDKGRSPFTQYSQGTNGGLGGVVWRDEIYSTLMDPMWGYEASNFGLVGMGKEVSVFVHLPDDYGVRDDRFRQHLHRGNGETVMLKDYQSLIISHRPQWLLDIIDQRRNKGDFNKAINDKLKAHAAMLKRPVAAPANTQQTQPQLTVLQGGLSGNASGSNSGGSTPGGKPNPENPRPKVNTTDPVDGEGSGHGKGGQGQGQNNRTSIGNKGRKAPSPMVIADVKAIPEVIWTKDLEQYAMLRNRGAYYVDSMGVYILNETYPAFKKIVSEVIHSFILPKRPHLVRDAELEGMVEAKTRDHIATLVGMAILNAENKRNDPAWSEANIAALLSVEALTSVYDVCLSDTCYISPAVTNMPEFRNKNSLAEKAAAAVA